MKRIKLQKTRHAIDREGREMFTVKNLTKNVAKMVKETAASVEKKAAESLKDVSPPIEKGYTVSPRATSFGKREAANEERYIREKELEREAERKKLLADLKKDENFHDEK